MRKMKSEMMNPVTFAQAKAFLSSHGFSRFLTSEYLILPGFCDVHVHFREPGFSYKETIATGSASAAHGGYTAVCTMPNLSPVPDCHDHLREQIVLIEKDASIAIYPYAAITEGQKGMVIADMEALASNTIAFSDDGRGVQSDEIMEEAMRRAKVLGKMIVAHCEVNSLLHGGYIHDGEYAKSHGHRGICSESEYLQIERDIVLAKKTGCPYHVCHISTKESVDLIRAAKRDGVDITCETAPHYLVMDDSYLQEDGRFKMNPPLRDRRDREALVDGILDGTIDMIATDHAPHSKEEKSRGLANSAFGIVGLETAFSVIYTHLIKTGIITLDDAIRLMSSEPRKRFGITSDVGFSVWKTDEAYTVDPDKFKSKGRATPFAGETLYGVNVLTVYNNTIVFEK